MPAGVADEEWDEFHSIVLNDEMTRYVSSLATALFGCQCPDSTRLGYMGVNMGLGSGNGIACPLIRDFGSEEQKLRYLPKAARGEIRFCLAITEPDGTPQPELAPKPKLTLLQLDLT